MSASVSPSTADFSIFSSAASVASPTSSRSSTPKTPKRSRRGQEGNASQKRRKVMGRPRNGWTPSRHRKLVRLYLMTNLEVDEIAKVLRTDGFKTCKRDIQTQLANLLQARPSQIRSRGQFTKQRLFQLRECRRAQSTRRAIQYPTHDSEARKIKEDDGTDVAVHTEEHISQTFSPISTCPGLDFPWFNPEWDTLLFPDEDLLFNEPDRRQCNLVKINDSSMILALLEEIGLTLFPAIPSAHHEDPIPKIPHRNFSYPTIRAGPDLPLPDLPTRSPFQSNIVQPISPANELHNSNDIFSAANSQSYVTPAVTINHAVAIGPSTDNHLIVRLGTTHSTRASVVSLKKRLSHATERYSPSCLEDIVSLMGHFTISTSSSSSIAPSRLSRLSRETPPTSFLATENPSRFPFERTITYPIILPGEFPKYCWEQITNNMLHPCYKGQNDRKKLVCQHITQKPRQFMNDYTAPYKAYIGPGKEKVDIFGNTALHIAATLATSFDVILHLIRSDLSVHILNNAGQTFLHLIHPDSAKLGFGGEDFGNDICMLFKILQAHHFNFDQRDHQGRTTLHGLTQWEIPHSVLQKISKELSDLAIPFPKSRDNLGYSVMDHLKFSGVLEREQVLVQQEPPSQSSSFIGSSVVADEYNRNCLNTNHIETVEDLQRYAYQADLLSTINRSWNDPQFEDSQGRNGLHCLAEVTFDLPNLVPGSPTHSVDVSLHGIESIQAVKTKDTLKSLLLAGVDPNNYDKGGSTPLMAFIVHMDPGKCDDLTTQTLQLLVGAGADINKRNRHGETCLHLAVKLGRRTATNFLLRLKANVHVRNSAGLGIVALGHESARKAMDNAFLYAQIMLCVSLVVNCGAVSTPTIIGEWRMSSLIEAPVTKDQVRYKGTSWTPLEKLKRYRA